MKSIRFIFLLLIAGMSYVSHSQCSDLSVNAGTNTNLITETLYQESFVGQNGKGAIGTNPVDLVGCSWTIDVNAASLTNTNDYFKVNSEKLEARDVDGICYWYSPIINIQNYINVDLSLIASQLSNSSRYEADDVFYSEYSLDGSIWTYFTTNGQMSDGLPSSNINVTQNGLRGSTVQIRVTMDVDQDNERFKLDDIKVTGQAYKINLCFGDPLNLGGSPTANWAGSGNPTISYIWSPSTNLTGSNISNPIATPTSPVIYKVVASMVDNGVTCKDSSLFYVNVTPQVSVSNSSPVCINDTLTISEHGGNATAWTWSSNGNATIISSNDSSSQVVGMVDGEIFSVYVEDDDGCSNTATTTILVNPKPSNVTSSNYGNYCSSDPEFPLIGGSPLGGYYNGVGVTNNSFNPSAVGYGSSIENVNILYIYADLNGCRDTSISQVSVQKAPEVELTSSFLSLSPTDTNYIVSSPGGDWSKCGNQNPTFNLKMNISNISVVNNSASINYDIDYGNGFNETNILPGTIYNNTYFNEGPYIITVTATDNITGCIREYKKNFFFGTNPAVSLGIPGGTQNQCAPKRYGFIASFSNNAGILNSPGTVYRKYTNDGKDDSTFIHPNPATDLLSDTIFHSFDESSCGYSSQAYDNSFLLGVAATNGCGSSSAEVSPITQSSPPEAYIEIEDSIFCINSPVTFRDTSLGGKYVYGVNTGSGFTYECDTIDAVAWEFTPNTGYTVTSGSLGNYSGLMYFDNTTHGTPEIQVVFQEAGKYSVQLKKVSPCGNSEVSDEDLKSFMIDSLPDAEFTLDKDMDCAPLDIKADNISKSIDDFNAVFDWTYSTLTVGCQGSAPPLINKAASDSVIFEIYNEDFTGQNGKGALGTTSDLTNVNWNILVNNSIWDNSDWFYVKNERFEAVDVTNNNNDTAYWYSPNVDISNYQYVFSELKAFTNNSGGVKSMNSQYKVDGGLWTDFSNNSMLSGNFASPSVVSTNGINGNNIQLRIGVNLSVSTDTIFFDDIKINGYSIPDSLNADYSFNLPGIYTINLTATNVCGSDIFKDTVTAIGPPVLSIENIIDTCDTKTLNPSATIDTCFGTMNTYNWSFPGSIANNISILETPNPILYDSVGVFKVYFNASNQCGLDSDSLGFEIHDNPVISMIELDSVCFGLSLGLSASISEGSPNYNYLWSSVNAAISNTGIANPVVSTIIDNNIYLEVTDLNNCKGYDTIFIDVLELPTVNPGLNQSICPEDTAFLLGSISDAIPPYTFTWDSPSLSDQTILNPYYEMNGSKIFTLTAIDSFGCVNSSSVSITEFNSPIVNAGLDTSLCNQNIAVDFNGLPNGGLWSGNKIDNLGLFMPNGIAQDTAIYQYTDGNGCYNEDTLVINVAATVLADAGIDFEKCISETQVPLNGLPLGGYWNHVNINSQIFTVTQSDTLDLVYFYGSGNCINNDTMNLVINPLPIVDPGNDFESCIDHADELLVPSVLTGTWFGNGITNPNGIFNPSSAGSGIHNLNYFFRDSNNCEVTESIQATVYSLPVVIAQIDSVICDLPVNVTLNASPNGGNWIDSNITNNGIYSPDGPGVFKIYYEYTDINTCYNIDSMILTVNPPQIANAGADIQACADTGLIMLNGLPPAAGNWFGNGVTLSGDYNVLNPDTVDLAYNIGTGNCFTTDTMNILIHPLPKIILDSSFQICLLDEDTTIQFSPFGGLLEGTGILNSSTGIFSPSTAGVGIHKLIYSYQHPVTSCWNYDSLEITVQSLPNVNYTHDTIFCLNVGHQVTNTTTTVQNHYWSISNGTTSNLNSPVFNLNTVGFYDLNYVAETSAGCTDSMKTSFEVLVPPTASFSSPDSGCGPLLVDFTNNSTGKYIDYLWDLGFDNHLGADSITIDTIPSIHSYPAGIYFDTTYYTSLTVTNLCGVAVQNTEVISMPKPVSRFGLLSNIGDCLSGSVTLANNSYGLPDVFYWDFGDGSFGANSDTLFDHYYAPGNTNTFFNIIMSVTNECGTDTTTETVTIAPSNLVAFFSVDTTVGCVPFTLDFNQFTVNGSNNQSWDFDDGNFSNLYSPSHTFTDSGIYQVSLSVSNACNFDTAYKTIRVNTSPNISFNVIDDTLCAGSTFQFNNLSDNGISNNWDFGDSSFSYLTNPTHIFTDSGSYRVILTGSSLTNSCEAYDSVDLVVLPYPVITATSDTSSGCIPLPVSFSSTTNSVGYYLWDFGDGNTSTLDNPSHTYIVDGYYSVNLRFEDLSGCVDSFDFDIIPHPVPTPIFTPIQLDTCVLPINYNFQNNSLGASSYNWDFGDGNNSTITLPNNTYSNSGTYTIKLVTSNTYGCSDSITNSIIVKPVTNAQFDAIQLDTCKLPANYSLVNNSTGSIAYVWDFGDGSTSNLPTLNHSYITDGNYQISLISMNSVGCFDTSFVDINVLPVPSLVFNYTQLDTCSIPSNFSFQNSSTGGNSYLWDFGDGLFSPIYSPSHTFNTDGTYNVKISASNIFGCSDSLIQPITVNPVPVAQFTASQLDTCVLPASFSLVNNSSGAIFNSWDLGNGASSNNPNFTYSYTSSGSYDISLLVMNQFGCLDSLTSSVNVSPVPEVSFNYTKLDSCILPSNYSFTNTSTGGNSYLWTFDTIANSIQNSPLFTFNNDGIYQVTISATNSLGCSDSAIDYINVSPIPIANFSLDSTIGCEPFNAIFTNNSQYSNFYNWDFNDGNTGSFLNGSHEFQNFGNYTVKLVVEDLNGCKDSIFEDVNVYPTPISNYTYIATDPCYLPINVDFSNTSTGGNSFQWDFGNGQITTSTNPSTIYDSIGIFNIQLITGNSYNCFDTLNNNFDVFYNQVPDAQLNFEESICLRDTAFLYSSSLFSDSLIWDLGNGLRLNGDSISFVFDSVGQFDITLFAYNTSSGCSDTSQGNNPLIVLPSPTADFELNQVQGYEPLSGSIEFINNSIGADTYLWDFANIDTSFEEYPTYYYSYDSDGTYYYTLYAFSSNQCVDSLTKALYIEFKKALYVPNALYPTATNYEVSRFVPKGTGMKKYKVEVFDLYGNIIWESTALDDEGQPTESWNGQFRGIDVEPDVYIWKIEAQFKDDEFWGGQKPIEETILRKTGTLTVIR